VTASGYVLLEDGRILHGEAGSAPGTALGEVVFTTGMTGYQESLTDPSFAGQIITFTAPMIGNYGVQGDVGESDGVQVRAVICREVRNAAPPGRQGLVDWLDEAGIPVVSGIDTRALVRHLRERGAMRGAIVTDGSPPEATAARIAALPEMAGQDLAAAVSRPQRRLGAATPRARVTLLDYGAKDSIGRLLAEAGADVTVVPHDATAEQVAATDPDGVLLANGPGDPGAMDGHVANVRAMLEADRPLFGICLGHQLLARALGLDTFKLRFGHRGANHPVLEQATGRVLVTSQNHGFAVAPPEGDHADVVVTHVSLYDGTVEGLQVDGRPVWSMQFHPEASPGPHDARDALVRFVEIAAEHARSRA
jgi:carbamoyl-phosphate synthase small subunit